MLNGHIYSSVCVTTSQHEDWFITIIGSMVGVTLMKRVSMTLRWQHLVTFVSLGWRHLYEINSLWHISMTRTLQTCGQRCNYYSSKLLVRYFSPLDVANITVKMVRWFLETSHLRVLKDWNLVWSRESLLQGETSRLLYTLAIHSQDAKMWTIHGR